MTASVVRHPPGPAATPAADAPLRRVPLAGVGTTRINCAASASPASQPSECRLRAAGDLGSRRRAVSIMAGSVLSRCGRGGGHGEERGGSSEEGLRGGDAVSAGEPWRYGLGAGMHATLELYSALALTRS